MGASVRPIGPPRFAVAVHILVGLARSEGNLSSATLAGQVNSHATFMRRILARLAQAGLVEAREGRDGGYSLKLPAERISLADVLAAVTCDGSDEEAESVCDKPSEACEEAAKENERLDQTLSGIMDEVKRQSMEYLKGHTIASLI
ncbi:RrF2 family transcriptional regulator [Cohnella boryungensis]|uniref:RrF2 family transcriptional regulator n=1 Tax=Cohnella boryungensis TaxID=768479 RepID=A0ABV8S7T9_9BACL